MRTNLSISHFYHTGSISTGSKKFINFFTCLKLTKFRVVIYWFIMYILSVFLFNIIFYFLKIKNAFPIGLPEFLNSIWGGFLTVTLLLAIILNYIYSGDLYINEILKILKIFSHFPWKFILIIKLSI